MDVRNGESSNDGFPENILDFLRGQMGSYRVDNATIQAAKSAQQCVWILTFPSNVDSSAKTVTNDELWKQALEQGSGRLVVRLWKSARRWWNLNHVSADGDDADVHLQQAAQSEVTGYRLAREAVNESSASLSCSPKVWIPRVLYVSWSMSGPACEKPTFTRADSYSGKPWAILEYMGEYSSRYQDQSILPDSCWLDGMVRVRQEFGFVEPHPRWGRVPVEQSLIYAQHVLQTVVVPLHKYQWERPANWFVGLTAATQETPTNRHSIRGLHYMDMVKLYHTKYKTIIQCSNPHDKKVQHALDLLKKAIVHLEQQACENGLEVSSLPCVTCHMDLQPQNLLFATRQPPKATRKTDMPIIVSVLDWEEAAYADPRFELLLLCRKVVANRTQADCLWQSYQQLMSVQLGPIDPWLRLETVHSLTTMLLQACAGGGRNPWENKPDLWKKMEREFHRLASAGWSFCRLEP